MDTALTSARMDLCAYERSWGHGSHIGERGCVLTDGHGGYSSDISPYGRVCLSTVMVDRVMESWWILL